MMAMIVMHARDRGHDRAHDRAPATRRRRLPARTARRSASAWRRALPAEPRSPGRAAAADCGSAESAPAHGGRRDARRAAPAPATSAARASISGSGSATTSTSAPSSSSSASSVRSRTGSREIELDAGALDAEQRSPAARCAARESRISVSATGAAAPFGGVEDAGGAGHRVDPCQAVGRSSVEARRALGLVGRRERRRRPAAAAAAVGCAAACASLRWYSR